MYELHRGVLSPYRVNESIRQMDHPTVTLHSYTWLICHRLQWVPDTKNDDSRNTLMSNILDNFITDCRDAIRLNEGHKARQIIKEKLSKLTSNPDFVNEYCGADAEVGDHILHKDPELGFMIINHVRDYGKTQPPHDHGDSWAIYSQTVGHTDIYEYERHDDGSKEGYSEVSLIKEYKLTPGVVGVYDPGDIHSIHYEPGVRFIRMVGNDFTLVSQRVYDIENNTYKITDPTALATRI